MFDDSEKQVLDFSLAENWAAFEEECEDNGADADEIARKLNEE